MVAWTFLIVTRDLLDIQRIASSLMLRSMENIFMVDMLVHICW